MATCNSMSCGAIKTCLGLKATKWTVLRYLQANNNAKYTKMKPRPMMKAVHIRKRLDFARQYIYYRSKWETILFSDERKFNLDGPDGFKIFYRHNLRKEPKYYSKRASGGGSVIVWAAVGHGGKTEIVFQNGKLNSEKCQQMIEPQLMTFGRRICGSLWTFQ